MAFERGDVIYRSTLEDENFYHEGVYIGDDQVVHVIKKKDAIKIRKDSLETFAKRKPVNVKRLYHSPFTKEEIARRAESMVGKKWRYDRFFNNCETFTNWASTGRSESDQAEITLHLAWAGALNTYKQYNDFPGFIVGLIEGFIVARALNKILHFY